ncbi:hypothetical protein MMO39_10120 [Acinetobacter modestus]|uniref:hypothetical protein n=1 Tax=Acinetobacter modestus TaxID=1776740 RepID=UPI001F4AACB9|nr:hypothetical protein [Acinetobacter modestus]MCH7387651.1 hypothetical protein [Acinetobacter modestus]
MNFQSIQKAFDEYILRFDSFPDLILMGSGFQINFLNENPEPNWKVLLESKYKITEVMGCKVILVPYYDYEYRFGFYEFDDLEQYKNHVIDDAYRKSTDSFHIYKNMLSSSDIKPWESLPTQEAIFDPYLTIPFSVQKTFKNANISKKEIEKRKQDYSIRKGIYEPDLRF